MKARTLIGGMFALLWLTALPAWATEYHLQVANIDDRIFSSYEGNGSSFWSQKEPMGNLEARLDQQQFSRAAILPGHHVELLEDPAYGGTTPTKVSLLPATGHQDWSTYVFDANPGDTVTFVVRTDMAAWQQAVDVAADANGTLRRLSIGGPGIVGDSREVPQVSEDFLANAVDRDTFPQWLAQHATAVDGMSFVVGQGDDPYYNPDRVYITLKLPPQPHTFQAVIAGRIVGTGWMVATYSQITLTAFQQVEDNLAALRVLAHEMEQQQKAVGATQECLELATNRYRGGVDTYLQIITAQTLALANERNAVDIMRRRMDASSLLTKTIGGGWDVATLPRF
jgi:hypothetical protein